MIRQYTDKKDNKKYYEIKNHYIGKDVFTGREKRISKKGFRTKKDAEQHIFKIKSEFSNGGFQPSQDYTFQDVYDIWIENYKLQVKESTFYNNIKHFESSVLPFFSTVKVKDINLLYCQKFINELAKKYKKGTVKHYKILANMILDFAVKMDIIQVNYLKYTQLPRLKDSKKENYYSKRELLEFLEIVRNNFSFKIYLAFHLLAFTGIRRGELLALTWKDINFKEKTLTINKNLIYANGKYIISDTKTTSSNRTIYLDENTINLLKEYRKRLDFISVDSVLFNYTLAGASYWLTAIYIKFPHLKKISVHGFRHTHATLLFESGVNVKDISNRLGHSDIQTTLNVYTHITESKKKDTTELFNKYMSL